ncbi:MAG: hypothetical protein LLG04_09355 [Parachlamydia sp.]|nr:hypothetical protein [Parachlamydia sp.]
MQLDKLLGFLIALNYKQSRKADSKSLEWQKCVLSRGCESVAQFGVSAKSGDSTTILEKLAIPELSPY